MRKYVWIGLVGVVGVGVSWNGWLSEFTAWAGQPLAQQQDSSDARRRLGGNDRRGCDKQERQLACGDVLTTNTNRSLTQSRGERRDRGLVHALCGLSASA